MAPDVSNSRDRNFQFINSDTEMSASPGLVVSSFERYILTTVANFVLLMADSILSVRRCLSPSTALELRAVVAWLVSSGPDFVVLCSGGPINFQLQYMMSFIVSSFTTPKLSTLKTWLVRTAIDCKVSVDSHHAKRVESRDAWPLVLVASSLTGMRKVWQPETHLLYWYVSPPRAVWTSGGTLFVQLTFMRSLYNSPFSASVRNTPKSWSDRPAKEPDCKITEVAPLVKRVVSRGDAKVDNTVQPDIGMGLHSSRCNSEQWDKLWTPQSCSLRNFLIERCLRFHMHHKSVVSSTTEQCLVIEGSLASHSSHAAPSQSDTTKESEAFQFTKTTSFCTFRVTGHPGCSTVCKQGKVAHILNSLDEQWGRHWRFHWQGRPVSDTVSVAEADIIPVRATPLVMGGRHYIGWSPNHAADHLQYALAAARSSLQAPSVSAEATGAPGCGIRCVPDLSASILPRYRGYKL